MRWADGPGGHVVLDSRTGAERPLELTDLESRVLDACREPLSIRRLAERVATAGDPELFETLASLRSHRLVIEESDRVMSVVENG